MIAIVVDTNILRESPYLSRPEWISLSAHKADWQINLLVPDVVVMETTKVVPREWVNQKEILNKAKVGTFGLQDDLDALKQVIQDHIDNYGDQLRSRLSELGANVVPYPDVPHSDIAFRASRGIAPYHAGDKDGYRDTLIWLTVLDVATTNPDHEVWFVSNNVNDFGDPEVKKQGDADGDRTPLPRPLHPQLRQDLEDRGLNGRVKYSTSLQSLEQHIAALHGPISDEDLAELISLLDLEALENYMNDQARGPISPKDAALTPGTVQAIVAKLVPNADAWTFSDAAGRGEDRWTANYVVDAEAEIFVHAADPSSAPTVVNKFLRVTGTAAFYKSGVVEAVQVSRIEALPDDPDRGVWGVLDSTGFGQLDVAGLSAFLQASQFAQGIALPTDTLKAMAQAVQAARDIALPTDTLKAMARVVQAARGIALPADTLNAMARVVQAARDITPAAAQTEGLSGPGASSSVSGDEEETEEDDGGSAS